MNRAMISFLYTCASLVLSLFFLFTSTCNPGFMCAAKFSHLIFHMRDAHLDTYTNLLYYFCSFCLPSFGFPCPPDKKDWKQMYRSRNAIVLWGSCQERCLHTVCVNVCHVLHVLVLHSECQSFLYGRCVIVLWLDYKFPKLNWLHSFIELLHNDFS